MEELIEIWKDIKDYKGLYQVSNMGNVRSLDRIILCKNGSTRKCIGKLLKHNIGTNGYYYVILSNINTKTAYIHRLVATTFINNINNLSDVDHINEDKLDNRSENLQWLSHFDNSSKSNKGIYRRSSAALSKNPRAKKVYCYDNNKLIKLYLCAKELTIEFGINYSTLRKKLQNDILFINNLKYTYNEIIINS